jgi:RES domain-containing protein
MRLWRICRRRFAASAWAGEGARLYGGRWNSPGARVVYTSTSLALAAIEVFVHLEPNLQPGDLVSIAADLPEDLPAERLELSALPANWARRRDESLRKFGDEWLREARTAALMVPSAAIRGEWNVLLNPAHPGFGRIKPLQPQPFEFDLRMFH